MEIVVGIGIAIYAISCIFTGIVYGVRPGGGAAPVDRREQPVLFWIIVTMVGVVAVFTFVMGMIHRR